MTKHVVSRRQLLTAAGAGSAAVLLAGQVSPTDAAAAGVDRQPAEADRLVACHGEHQSGIVTPAQRHLLMSSFDITTTRRHDLVELLRAWQVAIERLAVGAALGRNHSLNDAPGDTGEAAGQGGARLTVTIGFGPSLFDGRFGLAAHRPPPLIDLPAFAGEALDPTRSGGDISIQACSDTRIVAEHAVRDLARVGAGAAKLRWTQGGFADPPVRPPGTGRNLLGFKDGTANLDPTDAVRMARNVWAAPGDGAPWMAGGTYQVYRRVRLKIEDWDASSLDEQQDTFGRFKSSGAPYGATNEFDPVNNLLLPTDSHVRLSNPRTGAASEDERILRRGYNFADGYDPTTGGYDFGLAFIAYQRDPRRQFVTIQQRLAASDALNEYTTHTASGVFAVPPGVRRPGSFVGATLLNP